MRRRGDLRLQLVGGRLARVQRECGVLLLGQRLGKFVGWTQQSVEPASRAATRRERLDREVAQHDAHLVELGASLHDLALAVCQVRVELPRLVDRDGVVLGEDVELLADGLDLVGESCGPTLEVVDLVRSGRRPASRWRPDAMTAQQSNGPRILRTMTDQTVANVTKRLRTCETEKTSAVIPTRSCRAAST